MSIVLPRYCCAIGVESASREKASLRTEAKTFTWWLTRRSWYAVSTSAICDRCQTLGDVSPASLERDSRLMMCLLKYSSMLSMKIATGRLMVRSRGTRRLSVSVADRKRSPRWKSSTLTKWSMTLCRLGSATRAARRGLTSSDSTRPSRLRTATATEISHTLRQLSVERPKSSSISALNTLSPTGLSSRLFSGRQRTPPLSW